MAKKAKVKPKLLETIDSTKRPYVPMPTAKTGQIGPDLIGANLTQLSHQLDSVEQSQQVDKLRKSAKERQMKKKEAGFPAPPAQAQTSSKADVIPPGTFKNADGELVIGDMDEYQKSQPKKKKVSKVKKKS